MNDLIWYMVIFLFGGMGSLIIYGGYQFINDYREGDRDHFLIVGGGMLIIMGLACMMAVVMAIGELLN